MSEWISIMQLARDVGVPYWQISYAETSGKLPRAQLFSGRRVYGPEDAMRVREYFAAKPKKRNR